MLINIQDDIIRLHSAGLLSRLLADKTTGRNIMWATDAYAEHGAKFERNEQIMPELIIGTNTGIIKTRARKAFEQQTERTRRRAEVFTPLWVCRKMTDYYYNDCTDISEPRRYIDSRQLEITCGESPFLVSRYDTTTGEPIPIAERIGLLDRKLQLVGKTAENEGSWLKLAKRAYESTYGYEFQGDNLLIARVNLIETFAEYMQDRWNREPTTAEMRPIINIITWNVWQMDGLNGRIPYKTADEDNVQLSFFEEENTAPTQPPCMIYDWRARRPLEYNTMGKGTKTMKFDFVIGNPPYQEDVEDSDNKTFRPPIYNLFLDASYDISDRVELIHPARFLFNAGQTPKVWNEKMLSDTHLKVLYYEPDGSKIFNNTEIKGGIVITYHDTTKEFGAIQVFTKFPELNAILHRVTELGLEHNLTDIMSNQNRFDLEALYAIYPKYKSMIGSNGKDRRFRNNIFDKIDLFSDDKVNEDDIAVLGVVKNKRVWKYFPKPFVDMTHENINKWKVLVGAASGAGVFGETISSPMIVEPMQGYTQTYIGIGAFDTKQKAENAEKYVKTKFARTMLGILKITQHNDIGTWRLIPLQDFTSNSDIDWSKSIPEIDKQLYKKYGLTDDEITFIETHVKEMS